MGGDHGERFAIALFRLLLAVFEGVSPSLVEPFRFRLPDTDTDTEVEVVGLCLCLTALSRGVAPFPSSLQVTVLPFASVVLIHVSASVIISATLAEAVAEVVVAAVVVAGNILELLDTDLLLVD